MKPSKITLTSSNEELLLTMNEEGKSVEYWHKKHYGGTRKYDKWQDEQLEAAEKMPADSEILGEMIDYHSLTTGNRWKTFEVTSCYGPGNVFTRMFKFCYWDTYGSVGAFYNCVNLQGYRQLMIFPSHFFLRYAERMKVQHRDAALVCEFFNRNHAFAIVMSSETDDEGRRQFIIAVKEGACYGFARTNIDTQDDLLTKDNVFEVRTFLTYDQMSKRQLEECKGVRELAEVGRLTDGAPEIHHIGRTMTDEAYANKALELTAKGLGITKEQMEDVSTIMQIVISAADFVSGDMRSNLKSLVKGKVNPKIQRSYARLSNIIADHVRSDRNYLKKSNPSTILDITREWKGDNYDWNKWFWHLLHSLQEYPNIDDNTKAMMEEHKDNCIRNEYTYEQIHVLLNILMRYITG